MTTITAPLTPFGQERTSGQCYARATWERAQASDLAAYHSNARHPWPGWREAASAHTVTAIAYEKRAQEIAATESDAYTLRLGDGSIISGRVQGRGGTLRAFDRGRLQANIDRANEGEALGIYEPAPGCCALKYYNPDGPDHEIEVSLVGAAIVSVNAGNT